MSTYYRKCADIAGYTFRADQYCPGCIHGVLPTGPSEPFDGWAFAPGVEPLSDNAVETALTELAMAFGIDRFDERSFDSGDFPKVIFVDQVDTDSEGFPQMCGACGGELT